MQAFSFKFLLRDKTFWAALAAGGLFWFALAIGWKPANFHLWFLSQPLLFLLPALIYPVLEEMAFRGLIQESLLTQPWGARQLAGLSHANIITSVLFTLAHFIYHPPLWAAGVMVPSLIFGYFRDKYRSVMPAILLHIFYNAGYSWLFGQ